MTTENETIDKIIKLLRKAEGTDNPEEAETFFAGAARLMERNAIDQARLRKIREGEYFDNTIDRVVFPIRGAYNLAFREMGVRIGNAFGLTVLISGDRNSIIWYGYKSDLEMGQLLWESVLIQADRAARVHMSMYVSEDPLDDRSERFYERRSYLMGFGAGVAAKIVSARATAQEEYTAGDNSLALAVIDRRRSVEQYVNEKVRPRNARASRSTINQAAYAEGKQAGYRADLGYQGRLTNR
jgi:hypothetical protein